MSWKSFFLGVLTGVILTFIALIAMVPNNEETEIHDPIKYLEKPVSYEDKTETSFRVIQVLDNAALATERSGEVLELYIGNTVLLKGSDFYNDQIIKVKNPQRIGTYSYTTTEDRPMTVPVIDGEFSN